MDETAFLSATPTEATAWVSSICDVDRRRVLDVIEGRSGAGLGAWLEARPEDWKRAVRTTVSDLHEPFRAALARHLPDAVAVADPFHVVAVGTRAVDKTRRRVQNETLGHRGRRGDPLYRARKLLAIAAERLDPLTFSGSSQRSCCGWVVRRCRYGLSPPVLRGPGGCCRRCCGRVNR